jgi:hypothetical protein
LSGFKDISKKYGTIIQEWPETRQQLALIMAHDAHALTADRIQNTGTDFKGKKYPTYSKKPNIPYWLINPTKFNAPSKIQRFKDKAAKGTIDPSYENLRREYGLPTDKRTLTFDGDMWHSIEQVVTEHDIFKTVVTIRAKDRDNQNKVNWNSGQLKSNILQFGKDEAELIRDMNKVRIDKILKGK